MGPIDPEGSDTKAIVTGSLSSGSSSPNMAASAPVMPRSDERPVVTTITITGVDGTQQTNDEAAASLVPLQMPDVAHSPPSGYSSVYVTNRMNNIQLGADPGGPGICAFILTLFSFLLILATFPLSLCFSVKVVQEYERAVIFRLGRLLKGGARGPGIFFIVPCIDTYRKVDLRTVSFDVPPQEILSRDSVTVAVDAVVYYRVQNPTIAVSNVENFSHSTRLLAATTLRNVLGTKNLAEILSERETISHTMQSSLDEATDPWGVKVERVEIKDVRLPVQLQRAMAAEAEAAREARAKVIAAEGEQKASRALRDAAEVIAESPAALQLRYLQTLNTISAEKNSTIIFPLPIDILKHFIKPGKVDKYDL
ncbi:band 7 protein AGAP004871-like isoform X4 [Daphnia pulicaria]|uniref:band 7 protein AGAP004871-like isoform X4 n=1 Tax=Daphnia pulicaria TaxID=35523 RepID=UPI001EEB07D0|nr:band 7 protein AGAP004871-like isoform X4 [Daphnia pulicaria]